MNNTLKLIISIVGAELAGIISSIFTAPSIPTWYADLIKPALNPPSWVFGPVWTTLYALMGVSVFLIWSSYTKAPNVNGTSEDRRKVIRNALGVFLLQLALNVIWSIIFFGLHSPFSAFICIIALWLAIAWTMIAFYKISKPAMWLLVPYILWVSFASYLNLMLWVLNR